MNRLPLLLLLTATPLSLAEELSAPVPTASVQERQQAPDLPPGEARLRAGIVLLGRLHDILAGIQDQDSAEAAVPPIMRLSRELQEWGRGFSAMTPLDEETRGLYEERYLPIINKINDHIRAQGERIAAAEFYGSANLPAALVRLVQSVQ